MRLLAFLVLVTQLSCTTKTAIQNMGVFPFILDGQVLTIFGTDPDLNNGSFSFSSNEIELMKGEFVDGQKIGIWSYFIGSSIIEMDWSVFDEKSGRFSFSYPSIWNIPVERDDIDLLIRTDDFDTNSQLIIYEHELDTALELESYFEQYLFILNNSYNNLDFEVYKITKKSEEFYYLKSRISGKKSYSLQAFLYKRGTYVYDFTYITKLDNDNFDEVVFFDFLYSLKINGEDVIGIKSEYLVQPVEIRNNTFL